MPYNGGLSGLEAAAYLHSAGFSGNDLVTAIAVGRSESGLRMVQSPRNSDGTYDWGFMQINDTHHPSDAVKTQPLANAKAAFVVYSRAGKSFAPWTAYKNGNYKSNLTFANQSVTALKNAGPKFEQDLIGGKNPGSDKNPITFPGLAPSGPLGGLDNAVSAVPNAITNGINALSTQFGKMSGQLLAIVVAVVLLALGVLILARSAATGVVGGVVKGALK